MKTSKNGKREFEIIMVLLPLTVAVCLPRVCRSFLVRSQGHLLKILKTAICFCEGRQHTAVVSC